MRIILKPQYGGKLSNGNPYFENVIAYLPRTKTSPEQPLFVIHIDSLEQNPFSKQMFYEGYEAEAELTINSIRPK